MLKYVHLKSFRKHKDLKVTFEPGLNVLRGDNEAGKSTVIEALLYALFGSKALRSTLADAVAYNDKPASFSAEALFTSSDFSYTIKRGKSGAELRISLLKDPSKETVVTGQRETAEYIENLLGVKFEAVKQILVATQNDIREVFEKDTKGIVESLAELDLIDEIIRRIQQSRPIGSTVQWQVQLEEMQENLVKPGYPDDNKLTLAKEGEKAAKKKLEKLGVIPEDVEQSLSKLEQIWTENKDTVKEYWRIVKQQEKLQDSIVEVKDLVTEGQIEKAEQAVQVAELFEEKLESSKKKFPTCDAEWDSSWEELIEAQKTLNTDIAELQSDIQEQTTNRAVTLAHKVKESNCPFCYKDLTDVPEVIKLNAEVSEEVVMIDTLLKVCKESLKELEEENEALCEIIDITRKCSRMVDSYWELGNRLPPVPEWVGGDVSKPPKTVDVRAMKRRREQQIRQLAQNEQAQKELASLTLPTVLADEAQAALERDINYLKERLEAWKQVDEQVTQASRNVERQQELFDQLVFVYERQQKEYEAQEKRIESMKATIQDAEFNNTLIKDLRDVKPQIRDKVWSLLLTNVSKVFSAMRSEPSVVSRANGEFLVDGYTVKNLSGSTLDILSLALRQTLSQVFLGNVSWLILDEPFAGCSEEREIEGVSTIQQMSTEQVILITHKAALDSFAANVIRIGE